MTAPTASPARRHAPAHKLIPVGVIVAFVLNAQQQLYSTRRDLAKARYDTLVNSLRLKAAAGTLGEVDLAELNALLEAR